MFQLPFLPDIVLRSFLERNSIYYPVDRWQRYTSVTQKIMECANHTGAASLLDVGGGEGIIGNFLPPNSFELQVVDLDEKAILKAKQKQNLQAMLADGCHLPFKENSFDIVVSVASIEHVPGELKSAYCSELKRVAKYTVIIYCPANSLDGTFQGTIFDQQYFNWYKEKMRIEEKNTREHLEAGLPRIDELLDLFPGAHLEGTQNGHIWLEIMKCKEIPYWGLLTSLWYNFFLKEKDISPPYYACILVWEKNQAI